MRTNEPIYFNVKCNGETLQSWSPILTPSPAIPVPDISSVCVCTQQSKEIHDQIIMI